MKRLASRFELADTLCSAAHVSAVAQATVAILSIPTSMAEISTDTVERFTICALLTLPSFLPFLFSQVYRALGKTLTSEKPTRITIALLAMLFAASLLPVGVQELILVFLWPVLAMAYSVKTEGNTSSSSWVVGVIVLLTASLPPFPAQAAASFTLYALSLGIGKLEEEAPPEPSSTSTQGVISGRAPSLAEKARTAPGLGAVGTLGVSLLMLTGAVLSEAQLACGNAPENLVQASTSLCLLMLACIPLACFYWNAQAAAKGGAFLAGASILLLLAWGYRDRAAFMSCMLVAVIALFLLVTALAKEWIMHSIHREKARKHIFYALCAVPPLAAISHLFMASFLLNGNAAVADRGVLLLALLIAGALYCISLFLWLSRHKSAGDQTDEHPRGAKESSPTALSHVEIEAALDTGTFTKQELKVAARLCTGMSLAAIAEDIGVAKSTVGTYAKRIYEKLDVNTQAEAVALLVSLIDSNAGQNPNAEERESVPGTPTEQLVTLRKALPHACNATLVLLTLLLKDSITALTSEHGQGAAASGFLTSDAAIGLFSCLACALAALAVFNLYRTRRTATPEICCTGLLAFTMAIGGFLPAAKMADTEALALSSLLHAVAACCCMMCIIAVAQRCGTPTRKNIELLVLAAIAALALRQIPGATGHLNLLTLAGTALVIRLAPLKPTRTAFSFSMTPPLKSLIAAAFNGFSVYVALYAGGVIAQQNRFAGIILSIMCLALLLTAATQVTQLAKSFKEPVYPLITPCMAAMLPGIFFGNVCMIGHPVDSTPLLLLCGLTLPMASVPFARDGAKVLLRRKELATTVDDEFLQMLFIKHGLTGIEAHVASLAAKGFSAPTIARELMVSPSTVRTHIQHVYRKLEVHKRDELTRIAGELYRLGVYDAWEVRSAE